MRRVLHILTAEDRPFSQEIATHQAKIPELEVRTFDLTQPDPDYSALLDQIFSADSLEVW